MRTKLQILEDDLFYREYLADLLYWSRRKKLWGVRLAAKVIGVSAHTLHKWESYTCKTVPQSRESIAKVCRAYDIDPNTFFAWDVLGKEINKS